MPPNTDAADSPPPSGSRPTPLGAFFDAWTDLCAAAGRRSLTAASALSVGTAEQREALAAALVALGHPEATQNPRTLGGSLRQLRARQDVVGGPRLEKSDTKGSSVWYVVGPLPARAVA